MMSVLRKVLALGMWGTCKLMAVVGSGDDDEDDNIT